MPTMQMTFYVRESCQVLDRALRTTNYSAELLVRHTYAFHYP